jgi:hypothetical protein
MSKDVGERTNEHAQHPEVVAKLTALLENYVAKGRSTPGAKQNNDLKVVRFLPEEARRQPAKPKK